MKIRYYLLEQFCVCFFKSFSNSVSKASSLAEQGHGSPPQVIFIADSSVVDGAKCPQSAPALTSGAGRVRGALGGEGLWRELLQLGMGFAGASGAQTRAEEGGGAPGARLAHVHSDNQARGQVLPCRVPRLHLRRPGRCCGSESARRVSLCHPTPRAHTN